MTHVRLELNRLQIHRPKERWQLYFVLVADHPTAHDQLAVTVIPSDPILVVPGQKNIIHFEPGGPGTEGLLLISRDLPASRELNVHFYVLHSRRSHREIGQVLQRIGEAAGSSTLGGEMELLGISSPWLRIARNALPVVGKTLTSLPDRNLGFISMYERFGPEFEQESELDREVRGGHVTGVYSWSVLP